MRRRRSGGRRGAVFWVYSHKSDSTEPGSRLLMLSSACGIVVNLIFDSCAVQSVTKKKKHTLKASAADGNMNCNRRPPVLIA